ncbi:MAG: lipopolysaccharide biosynthesis protein [Prevotella sp.]
MLQDSLKAKTIKGTVWSAIDNITQMGVSFLVSIVLARLLSPDDYGLIGIIGIFTVVCSTIINGGFSSALIRKKEITDDDYNTTFIVNLVSSLLLYAILFVSAPLIAKFFNREELVILTRVSTLSMVIGAMAIVQHTRLTKRIDFKTQTKITLTASVVSGVIGISMAIWGFGVWALVVQMMVSQILSTILLWLFNRWTPRFRFCKKSFQELFGFGWKMMISGILDSLWIQMNQVVIAKFYNTATLGQYSRADHYSQLFSSNLTSVIQRVTYPVLSEMQDDRERMVGAYRRVIKQTMFFTFSSMFALGAIAEPLIHCMIGEKWHEAATYLPLICFIGASYPLHAINLNMLMVQGRSDLFLRLEIIKKIIGLAPLFVGAFFGIFPMLYTTIAFSVICYFLNSYYPGKLLGYSSWMQLRDISKSFFIALTMAFFVFFLKYLPLSNWCILPIQIAIGITIFFVLCKLSRSEELKEFINILHQHIHK